VEMTTVVEILDSLWPFHFFSLFYDTFTGMYPFFP